MEEDEIRTVLQAALVELSEGASRVKVRPPRTESELVVIRGLIRALDQAADLVPVQDPLHRACLRAANVLGEVSDPPDGHPIIDLSV